MSDHNTKQTAYIEEILADIKQSLVWELPSAKQFQATFLELPSARQVQGTILHSELPAHSDISLIKLLFTPSNRKFVELCYWLFLNRAPDNKGLLNYCQLLASKKTSRLALYKIFADSPESLLLGLHKTLPWWYKTLCSVDSAVSLDCLFGSSQAFASQEITSLLTEMRMDKYASQFNEYVTQSNEYINQFINQYNANLIQFNELSSITSDIVEYLHNHKVKI
ncbi:MAG: DUF4214 domain-containing protein [Sulfuricurvum sp.]|nr:DUF4214 domain-containing protein [Sulfuricurvum sp.]